MSNFSDPAVAMAHRSAIRSIERVVAETAVHTPADQALREVAAQLSSGPAMVITGAGVSTDSGIPDYRGPQGSLSRHRPMTYQEFLHDPAACHRYWARSFVGWRVMERALPNATHYAIAELEHEGYIHGVLTQNVDGLHKDAGTRNLIALHGDMETVECLDCGASEERKLFDARLAAINPGYVEAVRLDPSMVNPDGDVTLGEGVVATFRMAGCLRCGSMRIKPHVVYFGEPVPAPRKAAAYAMLEEAENVLVVGSSLAVMSGYQFVLAAKKQGKRVAVINGGPGRGDAKVDTLWRTQVEPAFAQLIDALL